MFAPVRTINEAARENMKAWVRSDILALLNEDEVQDNKKPMTQEQLADYVKNKLGDKWQDVIKTAYVKVIEKAEPGKTYETITRDENGGEWKETKNVAKDGQFLVQNAYGSGKDRKPDDKKDPSKWLISGDKIKKNYKVDGDVKVGGCYAPVPVPRKGIELTEPITIIASWDEEMYCKAGDWLVKAGENDIYRVEKVVFANTYAKGKTVNEGLNEKKTLDGKKIIFPKKYADSIMEIAQELSCVFFLVSGNSEGLTLTDPNSGTKAMLRFDTYSSRVSSDVSAKGNYGLNESNPCELGGGKAASNGGQTMKTSSPSKKKKSNPLKGAAFFGRDEEEGGEEEGGCEGAVEENEDEESVEKDGQAEDKPEKKDGKKKDGKKKSQKKDDEPDDDGGEENDDEDEQETIDDVIKEIKDKELAKRLKDALKLDRQELKDEIKELKSQLEGGQEEDMPEEYGQEDDGDESVPSETDDIPTEEPEGSMEEISLDGETPLDEADGNGKYTVGDFLVDAKGIKDLNKPAEVSFERDGKKRLAKITDFKWELGKNTKGYFAAEGGERFVRLSQFVKYFSGEHYDLGTDAQLYFADGAFRQALPITGFDKEACLFIASKI